MNLETIRYHADFMVRRVPLDPAYACELEVARSNIIALIDEIERLRGALREIEQYRCRTKDSSCVIWLQSLAKKALGE